MGAARAASYRADEAWRDHALELNQAPCGCLPRHVVMPMPREQIEQLRASVTTITIVELRDTTHTRFMNEKRREVVKAMSTFLKSKA